MQTTNKETIRMAQDPDIFNVNMALNPNSNFIVGLNHDPITRGEVNEIALSIVKGLLYRNLSKGSVIIVNMKSGIDCIVAETACYLGGYPFITIRPRASNGTFNTLMNSAPDAVVNLVQKLDVKFVLDSNTFREIMNGPKVAEIHDYPELTDTMYIGQTTGTSSPDGLGKYINSTRKNVKDSIEINRNANGIDDSIATWFFFGNPFQTYMHRTLQTIMLNGSGTIINHDPEALTPDGLIAVCERFNPTRMTYMRAIQDDHSDRERLFNKNPLIVVSNVNRPDETLVRAFNEMTLSDTPKTFKISGPCAVKTKIDMIEILETSQPSIKVLNSFGSSEITMRFESDYNDTLYNRIFKHGKITNNNAVRLDEFGEMQVHVDYVLKYIDVYSEHLTEDGLWFKTGNMFSVDNEGYLEFIGR